jgi:hypothetical protein
MIPSTLPQPMYLPFALPQAVLCYVCQSLLPLLFAALANHASARARTGDLTVKTWVQRQYL